MKTEENKFSSYELSLDELNIGSVFNAYQIAVLQNQMSAAAHEKVSLTYDPNNPLVFVQREAELQGIISTLNNLIETSKSLTAAS